MVSVSFIPVTFKLKKLPKTSQKKNLYFSFFQHLIGSKNFLEKKTNQNAKLQKF